MSDMSAKQRKTLFKNIFLRCYYLNAQNNNYNCDNHNNFIDM